MSSRIAGETTGDVDLLTLDAKDRQPSMQAVTAGTVQKGSSSKPLYAQVRDDLRARINSGEFKGGEALPPEPRLQDAYGVSRITLRRAVAELSTEGVVSKVPGRGTFVKRPSYTSSLMSLTGFGHSENTFTKGPRRQVLAKLVEHANHDVAGKLDVSPGDSVIVLKRLLMDGDAVLAYDVSRYAADVFPGFLDHIDDDVSTFSVMKNIYGRPPGTSSGTISAEVAGEDEARLLGLSVNEPVIVIDKIMKSPDGTPIALSRLMVDPYRVRIKFDAAEGGVRASEPEGR